MRQGPFHSSNVALKTRTPVHLQSASKSVEFAHDMANVVRSREESRLETLAAAIRVPEGASYFASYQETIVTSDGNQPSAQNVSYQICVLQVRIMVPADQPEKKTTKKI